MDACDVLIVGAGPAGSSCAWKLRHGGLNVTLLDKQTFPRDKVCGGWITPAVIEELQIDPDHYAQGRVLQPITGFRTGCISGASCVTSYRATVSYGIRRREFDDYLVKRSGARILAGVALESLERSGLGWIANGDIQARLVVGAGGHFCPVARLTGLRPKEEAVVVAQEAEFEMSSDEQAACAVEPEAPELYFCEDLKGYGWCFRKGAFLNVGLGRMDQYHLSAHVAGFLEFLKASGRISFDLPIAPKGHAYLLHGSSARKLVDDGLLLIGDAAGLAYAMSGEGIRPAIESGLLAAKTILAAENKFSRQNLAPYCLMIAERFSGSASTWTTAIGRHLPSRLVTFIGRRALAWRWFARDVVLNRWFLHADQQPLTI